MEMNEYYKMLDLSRRRVRSVSLELKRFLYKKIDWNDRLIAVTGARGTGKTTLILQHIKDAFAERPDDALYVSLDHLWFETHSLDELVDMHLKNGGSHVFIDEIHYMKKWQLVIKNLYDDYPDLNIVYTGSSLLQIDYNSGDLSRRQIVYHLPGLSLREYLMFEGVYKTHSVSLDELLHNHMQIAEEITGKIRILKFFSSYLSGGYYPFYKEVHSGYDIRLLQIVNQILESDYPAIESINYTTVQKIKKMLYILAQTCPQTPNMVELYRQLDTDRNQGLKMLYTLQRANLLNLLSAEKATLKNMSRPDKIYCDNTNLMYALTENPDTGTKRETFFLNQLRSAEYQVMYPKQGDFIINEKWLFEVGGKKKSFEHKDLPYSYLATDDVETGRNNRIPLWMFGFLY
ncbi:MAG: AAA family ATPase [Solobacterium sp.]|nr:AAA family ATPase [Solobacterium sp.]